MGDCVLRRFETPDETRTFERGHLDLIRIAGTTLGRARYEPAGSGPSMWLPPWGRAVAKSPTLD